MALGWKSQSYLPLLHLLPQLSRKLIVAGPINPTSLQPSWSGSFGSVARQDLKVPLESAGTEPCPWVFSDPSWTDTGGLIPTLSSGEEPLHLEATRFHLQKEVVRPPYASALQPWASLLDMKR